MRPLSIWGMQYAWDNFVTDDLKKSFGSGSLHLYEEKRSFEKRASALSINLGDIDHTSAGGALSRRKVRKV